MVQQVFGGRVGDATLDPAHRAVGRRGPCSRDLADVLERLSEIAIVRSAGARAGRSPTSCSSSPGSSTATRRCVRRCRTRPVDRRQGAAGRLPAGRQGSSATVTLAKQSLAGTYRTVTNALAAYREVAAETKARSWRPSASPGR